MFSLRRIKRQNMGHDVFISYSTKNREAAMAICHMLEQNEIRCWMAPRNIPPGSDYGDVIEDAIKSCKSVIVLFSETAAQSQWVKGEINIAFEEQKTIIPFRLDETPLKGQNRLILNKTHWIDAYPDYKTKFDDLVYAVSLTVGRELESTQKYESGSIPLISYMKRMVIRSVTKRMKLLLILVLSISSIFLISIMAFEQFLDKSDIEIIAKTFERVNNIPLFERNTDYTKTQDFYANGVRFRMKLVEKGSLLLGHTVDQTDSVRWDEGVLGQGKGHRVTITKDFWIGETEITQELWEAVMGENNNPSQFKGNNLPVEKISIKDCYEFLKKLSSICGEKFTLPTEAEWEYAARGGVNYIGYNYSGSDSLYEVAWHYKNSEKRSHDVAQLFPNELGIYDMSGNVYEWCEDYARKDFYTENMIDPCNIEPSNERRLRIIRGGSWHSGSTSSCRVAFREYMQEDTKASSLGLRIVMRPKVSLHE